MNQLWGHKSDFSPQISNQHRGTSCRARPHLPWESVRIKIRRIFHRQQTDAQSRLHVYTPNPVHQHTHTTKKKKKAKKIQAFTFLSLGNYSLSDEAAAARSESTSSVQEVDRFSSFLWGCCTFNTPCRVNSAAACSISTLFPANNSKTDQVRMNEWMNEWLTQQKQGDQECVWHRAHLGSPKPAWYGR